MSSLAQRRRFLLQGGRPALDLNLLSATLDSRVVFSRASSATDLLYTAASGAYNTFANAVPRISVANGLLREEQRTNSFLNSDTPATQTISLGTGTFVCWMIGSGSITSSAGTAVGSGFGAATQGTPNVITITGAGTVVFTAAGSVTRVQVENGSSPTSYIPAVGAAATRAADSASVATSQFAFNQSAGTIVAKGISAAGMPAAGQQLVQINDGGTDLIYLGRGGGGATIGVSFVGGGLAQDVGSRVWANNTLAAAAYAYSGGSGSVTFNGQATQTGTGALPTVSLQTMQIGAGRDAAWNGFIQRIRYWNRRLADGQLPALTL